MNKEVELRELLEVVAAHGPATRGELRAIFERKDSLFSGHALAEAIRHGLVRPEESKDPPNGREVGWLGPEEAYVLTQDGAITLQRMTEAA